MMSDLDVVVNDWMKSDIWFEYRNNDTRSECADRFNIANLSESLYWLNKRDIDHDTCFVASLFFQLSLDITMFFIAYCLLFQKWIETFDI